MAKRKNPYLRLWIKPGQLDYDAIHWYENANRLFLKAFGPDADFFIGLLAATSPRLQVRANLRKALEVYRTWKRHQEEQTSDSAKALGDLLQGLMYAHLLNVIRVLQGKPLQGPKVKRFAENLKGNLNPVTIDMWICKAYGITHAKLTPLQYERLERKIQGEALNANLKPAQYQALIWYAARRKGGYVTDQSFVKHYETLFQEFGVEVR